MEYLGVRPVRLPWGDSRASPGLRGSPWESGPSRLPGDISGHPQASAGNLGSPGPSELPAHIPWPPQASAEFPGGPPGFPGSPGRPCSLGTFQGLPRLPRESLEVRAVRALWGNSRASPGLRGSPWESGPSGLPGDSSGLPQVSAGVLGSSGWPIPTRSMPSGPGATQNHIQVRANHRGTNARDNGAD